MNDILARARESAGAWADRHIAKFDDTALFGRDDLIAAFAAGFAEADDQFDDQRRIGQQQLDDARALIAEARGLFRSYEAQHRDKAARWRHQMTGPDSLRKTQADIDDTIAKAERNALMAARLEAWLCGEDRYPTNPAEILRDVAEGLVDGVTIKGVDHASFDQAAAELAQPVPWRKEGVADLVAVRLTTGDPRFDPAKPANINGYLFVPAKED
jgi:hypothetical protein